MKIFLVPYIVKQSGLDAVQKVQSDELRCTKRGAEDMNFKISGNCISAADEHTHSIQEYTTPHHSFLANLFIHYIVKYKHIYLHI